MNVDQIDKIIRLALEEDLGGGDVTTTALISPEAILNGDFVAKEPGVVAGLEVVARTFRILDDTIDFRARVTDGNTIETGQVLAAVQGDGRGVLTGERVALNFLQRMSGVATMTRKFVEAVRGTKAIILDTRKTAPGLRLLDKWAVRVGGGQNHRMSLHDMVLIKENHIAVAGGISEAVRRVREMHDRNLLVEVEVESVAELREALGLAVNRILLDNMSLEELNESVKTAGGRVPLEASGKITLDNVGAIAATGVDFISVGALTHSPKALDVSFLVEPTDKIAGSDKKW